MKRQIILFAFAAIVATSASAQDRGHWDGARNDGQRADRGANGPSRGPVPLQSQSQPQPPQQRQYSPPSQVQAQPQYQTPAARGDQRGGDAGRENWRQQYQSYRSPQSAQPSAPLPIQPTSREGFHADPGGRTGSPDTFRGDFGRRDQATPQDWGRRDGGRSDGIRPDAGRPGAGRPDAGRQYPGRQNAGRDDWGRSDWSGRDGGRRDWSERGRDGGRGDRTWRYRGQDRDSYRISPFRYPHGWNYRSWRVGERLPFLFLSASYFIDYYDYDLPPPPYGYRWVRYGPDALLVNIYTGEVDDVIYGIFYW